MTRRLSTCRSKCLVTFGIWAKVWFAASVVALAWPLGGAYGQNISRGTSTGTSSSGMFGSSSIGLQSGSTPGQNSGGFGSGMTTGMGGNSGASQGQGGGQTQGGSLGLGSGMVQQQPGNFVGSSSQNMPQNFFSRQGQPGSPQAGRANFGSLGNLMTQSRQNQFNQQQAQRAARMTNQPQGQFRVPMRLGFAPAPMPPGQAPRITTQLSKVQGLTRLGPINASLEGGQIAVLQGTVATEADRQLAEGLVRLEPGVMAVRNELVVAQPGATPAAQPLTGQPAAVP
jgi:hypothetical protein